MKLLETALTTLLVMALVALTGILAFALTVNACAPGW